MSNLYNYARTVNHLLLENVCFSELGKEKKLLVKKNVLSNQINVFKKCVLA